MQLQTLLAGLTDTLQNTEADLAESVLDLALAVARKMIGDELRSNPRQLIAPIREALDMMPTATHPSRLYLNPQDLNLLRDELALELHADVWRLLPDELLPPGGCRIETPHTRLDYTLETRWNEVIGVLSRSPQDMVFTGLYPNKDEVEPLVADAEPVAQPSALASAAPEADPIAAAPLSAELTPDDPDN